MRDPESENSSAFYLAGIDQLDGLSADSENTEEADVPILRPGEKLNIGSRAWLPNRLTRDEAPAVSSVQVTVRNEGGCLKIRQRSEKNRTWISVGNSEARTSSLIAQDTAETAEFVIDLADEKTASFSQVL